ncbi:hypothetical protein GOBAR_AA01167 [Gossypium barbadense]|uniref:Uncharacterized protein n=1 Tax=Gossypium barbadense TaxID=3634 RepID=A0A2P5YV10_GOSBA|nr:hypothetical protein GOBAR_AA01167 [Gossypium barbadense]
MEADNFPHLQRHIHYAPSLCWAALMPATGIYDPSRSKALKHFGTILIAHTHQPDVPTGHPKYAPYEDDRASSWVRSSKEHPPSQPPPSHRPVHAAASLSEVSDHLNRFQQYCTQNIQTVPYDCHDLLDHDHSHHDTDHHDNLLAGIDIKYP